MQPSMNEHSKDAMIATKSPEDAPMQDESGSNRHQDSNSRYRITNLTEQVGILLQNLSQIGDAVTVENTPTGATAQQMNYSPMQPMD